MLMARRVGHVAACGVVVVALSLIGMVDAKPATAQEKTQYLVTATGGPGWKTPEEGIFLLENIIIPALDLLAKQAAEGTVIVAGGLPVGERALTFIIEAANNDEADAFVRSVPFWTALQWEVMPLQSFQGRADIERAQVQQMKALIAE